MNTSIPAWAEQTTFSIYNKNNESSFIFINEVKVQLGPMSWANVSVPNPRKGTLRIILPSGKSYVMKPSLLFNTPEDEIYTVGRNKYYLFFNGESIYLLPWQYKDNIKSVNVEMLPPLKQFYEEAR